MSLNKKTYTATEKAKIALKAIKGELSMAQITFGSKSNHNQKFQLFF